MTININAANITSIRLADQNPRPSAPASNFIQLYADVDGNLGTVKGGSGGIKIATSPASGDYTLTVDGTGTAARLNASNVFTSAQVLPAGSVGAPALTTTGDTNTGIYFPGADRMAFATGGAIRGSWTTNGLCFGSDTAAANALDDSEEGTWTPAVAGAATAGTASYTVQTGWYTKIGRLVTVNCRVDWANLSGSGDFQVTGLPFASWSTANSSTAGSAMTTNLNWSGGTQIVSYVEPNSLVVYFYNNDDDAGAFQQCVNETSARIYLTHTYLTA